MNDEAHFFTFYAPAFIGSFTKFLIKEEQTI